MGHSAPKIVTAPGLAEEIAAILGPMLIETVDHADELSFTVVREQLADALLLLRDQAHYQQLMEIAGVDYPDRPERFEVCYHLLSLTRNHRVRVKVSTDEDTPVPTVTHIWPVAGWLEREVFDMYGVIFAGNQDLRRILTDYGFKGHPQRKDFPLTGYVEMWYSEEDKRVVYKPVRLAQDFRSFDFMSPWEGAQYVLPGDEKAGGTGEAPGKGAPTPMTAKEVKASDDKAKAAPPPTPKTTEKPAQTGAGNKANKEAAKPSKDGAKAKADGESKTPATAKAEKAPAKAKAPAKPRTPRKPKTGGDA